MPVKETRKRGASGGGPGGRRDGEHERSEWAIGVADGMLVLVNEDTEIVLSNFEKG